MEENYFHKEYNINSKLKNMFEDVLGKKVDLSYIQIEQIVGSIFKNEDKKINLTFTDNDKKKIISLCKETNTSGLSDEIIDKLVKIFTEHFTDDEFKDYLDYCINEHYIKNVGKIFYGNRICVDGTLKILEKSMLYPLRDGIIANVHYINDLISLLDKDSFEFNFDKDTLMVEDDLKKEILERFNSIKTNGNKCVFIDDLVFIIATDDESLQLIKDSYKGLKVQKILDFKYYMKDKIKKEINSVIPISNIKENVTDNDDDDENLKKHNNFDIFKLEYNSEYESFSPTESNSDIDINAIKSEFFGSNIPSDDEMKDEEYIDDAEDYWSFMEKYEKNKDKRVICGICGSDDIKISKTCGISYNLNEEKFDVQFVIDNFINTNDRVDFDCYGCEDYTTVLYYKGRKYNSDKNLLCDIVKDMIIEQNGGIVPTSNVNENVNDEDELNETLNNNHKLVYCGKCGTTDLTLINKSSEVEIKLNSDEFDIKFVKYEFLDDSYESSDFKIICNGKCDECELLVYNNKKYELSELKTMIQDMVNDMEK